MGGSAAMRRSLNRPISAFETMKLPGMGTMGHHVDRGAWQPPELPRSSEPCDVEQALGSVEAPFHPCVSGTQIAAATRTREAAAFGVQSTDVGDETGEVLTEIDRRSMSRRPDRTEPTGTGGILCPMTHADLDELVPAPAQASVAAIACIFPQDAHPFPSHKFSDVRYPASRFASVA